MHTKIIMSKELCSLQTLSAVTIIRYNLDVSPILGHRMGDLVASIQNDFRKSDTLHNRLSGSLIRILSTYSDSALGWQSLESIGWFAASNNLPLIEHLWKLHSAVSVLAKLRLCFLCALTGPNYTCLEFVAAYLSTQPYNKHKVVVNWIMSDNVFMHKFESVSLSFATIELGSKSTMRSAIVMYRDRDRDIGIDRDYSSNTTLDAIQSMPFYNGIIDVNSVYRMMYKAIEVGAWEVIKWLIYLNVPISMIYVGMCLHLDRYDMIMDDIPSVSGLLGKEWIHWIWNHCSPMALQWCIINVPSAKHVLTNPCMSSATPLKIEILKDHGLWFPETKSLEAAGYCDLHTFKSVLNVCRSWIPIHCDRRAHWNSKNCKQIREYIAKIIHAECTKTKKHLCCQPNLNYRLTHPRLRKRTW